MKNEKLKKITFSALFSAVAFLLTFLFKFKVSFLTFDFKDAMIAIISLVIGPMYGLCSAGVVAFIEFLSVSDTGFYGLIMNVLSSGTFAFVIGTVYKYKRTFSGAILSVISASVSVVVIMMLANYFITPYYMGVSRNDVLALIPTLLLPFNLAKTVMNSAATLIIYKPITTALKRAGVINKNQYEKYRFSKKSFLLLCVSVVIIILTVIFIIYYLKGAFQIF